LKKLLLKASISEKEFKKLWLLQKIKKSQNLKKNSISTNVKYLAFTEGASTDAKSNGKLCALRSCITSIPKLSRLIMSAQVFNTQQHARLYSCVFGGVLRGQPGSWWQRQREVQHKLL
jgi:hypothetical protein